MKGHSFLGPGIALALGLLLACPHTREAAEVENVIDRFYAGARDRDWAAVRALLADDFEIFADGATYLDKGSYMTLMEEDDIAIEDLSIQNLRTRVSGDGRMAWSKYHARLRATSNGERHDVETVETLFFEDRGEGWRITHAHVSLKGQEHPGQ